MKTLLLAAALVAPHLYYGWTDLDVGSTGDYCWMNAQDGTGYYGVAQIGEAFMVESRTPLDEWSSDHRVYAVWASNVLPSGELDPYSILAVHKVPAYGIGPGSAYYRYSWIETPDDPSLIGQRLYAQTIRLDADLTAVIGTSNVSAVVPQPPLPE